MNLSSKTPDEETLQAVLSFLKKGGGGIPSGARLTVSGWHRAFVPATNDQHDGADGAISLQTVGWCCFVSSGPEQIQRLWVPSQASHTSRAKSARQMPAIELESGVEVEAWITAANKALAYKKRFQDLVYEPAFLTILDKMSSALVLLPENSEADAIAMPLCYRAKPCQRMNMQPLARFLARLH